MPPTPSLAVAGESFVDVPVRDRFFQSSAFFPMPIVLLSTRAPDGQVNLAPYSLCFPHVEGDQHAMVLVTRTHSKTAQNIERTGRAAINFIPDDPGFLENCRILGRPAPTAEKMARSVFTLAPSALADGQSGDPPPDVVAEAAQVFECVWDRSLPHETHGEERRFLLRVERIRLKERWRAALERGRGAPRLPVDYGFRQATASWMSRPRAVVSGPRLRPRFEIAVDQAPGEVVAAFEEALGRPGASVVGKTSGEHVLLAVPEEEQSFWSPNMDLRVEERDDGALVHGRIGPHAHVWTLFTGLHLLVAFFGVGGLMYGLSQAMTGESAWALWAIPIALFLHAFVAGAAFIGQGLGADQTYQLRSFMDDVLSG